MGWAKFQTPTRPNVAVTGVRVGHSCHTTVHTRAARAAPRRRPAPAAAGGARALLKPSAKYSSLLNNHIYNIVLPRGSLRAYDSPLVQDALLLLGTVLRRALRLR